MKITVEVPETHKFKQWLNVTVQQRKRQQQLFDKQFGLISPASLAVAEEIQQIELAIASAKEAK